MRDKRIEDLVLISQDFKYISDSFCENEIGLSYLFVSLDKVYAKTFVQMLIKEYFCLEPKRGQSCGMCAECVKVQNKTHIDVLYYGVEDTNIKKEEIKILLENAITKPYEASHKFLVIENAENLTDICQNLLLKTLEDLPSFVTIILISSNTSAILPTIKSRCQSYILKPVPKQSLVSILSSTERGLKMAEVSGGVISKALKYSQSPNAFEDRYKFGLNLLNNFSSSADILQYVSYFSRHKDHVKDIIEVAQGVFYLGLIDKITCMTKKYILANMIRLSNDCIDLLNKNILPNIVVDKFLFGILRSKLDRS